MKRDHSTNSRAATTDARSSVCSLSLMLQTVDAGGDVPQFSAPASSEPEGARPDTTMQTTATRSRRRRDPRLGDLQNRIGGQILAMTCGLQKQLALAIGKSEAWVSQLIKGHPFAGRYLRLVEDAERSGSVEAGPLAVAPLAEQLRVQAERFDDVELDAAFWLAIALETKREAAENAATIARCIAEGEGRPAQEIHELEERLALALVGEIAAEIALLGLTWERQRRAMLRAEAIH